MNAKLPAVEYPKENSMKKATLLLVVCSLTLVAADVTGTWSGTVKMNRDGTDQTDSARLILKQEGNAVTGSAGAHDGDQRPIENGKILDDQVTFDVPTDNGNFKVSLKLQEGGNTLTGQVRREREGNVVVAQLV